jgi:hypothetical protein
MPIAKQILNMHQCTNSEVVFPAQSTKQQLNSNRGMMSSVQSMLRCYNQDTQWEWVQGSGELFGELVRELQFSHCELLLLEAGAEAQG